jgi:hypothetical protein
MPRQAMFNDIFQTSNKTSASHVNFVNGKIGMKKCLPFVFRNDILAAE